ncbi:hypothetical protein A3Q37_06827 [Streptomyces sp. PTY087I2]|nr:hypothetical protein A3Q37_06827 [Streptomyces sp. PTY087I2]
MNGDSPHIAHLDGWPAATGDLAPLAFSGHAHFTAAQIRDGRIRGLDLHLERLRSASVELFGRALPEDVVRAHLRTALAAAPAANLSLTATVSSTAGEFAAPDGDPTLLVRTGPDRRRPAPPVRQAVADGFDDAAFWT